MKLLLGTNERVYAKMRAGEFNDLVWLTDNLETVAHYYEGCVVEVVVALDWAYRMDYMGSLLDLEEAGIPVKDYTYGYVRTDTPKDALWVSLSAAYLKTHVVSVTEVYPDLKKWGVNTQPPFNR